MASFHHRLKSGKKGTAKAHAMYIERLGKFNDREDLLHSEFGSLPDWAENEPAAFWEAADDHERTNGAVYREHEIALPCELSNEQNIELARRLVNGLVGGKPHQFAIHIPTSSLEGETNIHMHLMYSDRILDGIERSPKQTFARYNSKKVHQGGCRKDSGGKTRMELRGNLIALRKMNADIQNQMLAECGHDARVDHRSLKEQNIDRKPERHLGHVRIKRMSSSEKEQYVTLRGINKTQHQ